MNVILLNPKVAGLLDTVKLGDKVIIDRMVPELVPDNTFGPRGGPFMKRAEFTMREPFVTYGPEDIEYLRYAGKIVEGRSPGGFMMNIVKDYMQMPMMDPPRESMSDFKFSVTQDITAKLDIPKSLIRNS